MKALCKKVELSDGSFDYVIKEDRYKAEVQKWRKDCSIVSIGEPQEVIFDNNRICQKNINNWGFVSALEAIDSQRALHSNQEILSNIKLNDWEFAKTMPENPHYYATRARWRGDVSFNDMVQAIRDEGIFEKFRGRFYAVMEIGGFVYWTMGDPTTVTILINRRKG